MSLASGASRVVAILVIRLTGQHAGSCCTRRGGDVGGGGRADRTTNTTVCKGLQGCFAGKWVAIAIPKSTRTGVAATRGTATSCHHARPCGAKVITAFVYLAVAIVVYTVTDLVGGTNGTRANRLSV
jgi:hypothetical protein